VVDEGRRGAVMGARGGIALGGGGEGAWVRGAVAKRMKLSRCRILKWKNMEMK
jgi:hypothetical protein